MVSDVRQKRLKPSVLELHTHVNDVYIFEPRQSYVLEYFAS